MKLCVSCALIQYSDADVGNCRLQERVSESFIVWWCCLSSDDFEPALLLTPFSLSFISHHTDTWRSSSIHEAKIFRRRVESEDESNFFRHVQRWTVIVLASRTQANKRPRKYPWTKCPRYFPSSHVHVCAKREKTNREHFRADSFGRPLEQ